MYEEAGVVDEVGDKAAESHKAVKYVAYLYLRLNSREAADNDLYTKFTN